MLTLKLGCGGRLQPQPSRGSLGQNRARIGCRRGSSPSPRRTPSLREDARDPRSTSSPSRLRQSCRRRRQTSYGRSLPEHEAVREVLGPSACRLEGQGDDGRRRRREDRVPAAADGGPNADHDPHVLDRGERREGGVDDRLPDHEVDLVQAVLQDRDADGRMSRSPAPGRRGLNPGRPERVISCRSADHQHEGCDANTPATGLLAFVSCDLLNRSTTPSAPRAR